MLQPDPVDASGRLFYSTLLLPWRKTDQKSEGTVYEIHNDVLEPQLMANKALVNWISEWDRITSTLPINGNRGDIPLFFKTYEDNTISIANETSPDDVLNILLKYIRIAVAQGI